MLEAPARMYSEATAAERLGIPYLVLRNERRAGRITYEKATELRAFSTLLGYNHRAADTVNLAAVARPIRRDICGVFASLHAARERVATGVAARSPRQPHVRSSRIKVPRLSVAASWVLSLKFRDY